MDDRFLQDFKRAPAPEFAHRLRDRLRLGEDSHEGEGERHALRWLPLLAPGLLVAALASVILFPSVRASAQAFLDLFRIRTFTAVTVSPDRVRELEAGKLDLKTLVGDRVETLQEPGPPRVVDSPAQAGAAAGITVAVPRSLPDSLQLESVSWRGAGEARVTADVARLRALLETLAIRDLTVPMALDGQRIDVKVPAVVEQRFGVGDRRVELLQSRSPEMTLPTGVDLAALGEIGLRILGLQPTEARRLSQTIDWRSTMLIPVPGNAGSFRQVDVSGQTGLLVTSMGLNSRGQKRQRVLVLWSRGDMVYALAGNLSSVDMLQMANSVQ